MNKCYNDCTSNDVVHFMVDWDDVKNKPNVDDRLQSLEQRVDNIVTNSGGIDIDLDSEFSRLDNLISTTDNTLNDFKNEVISWQTNETQHINNVESGLNDLSSTVEDYRTQHVNDINYLTENVNLNRAFIESGLNAAGDNLNSAVEGLSTVIESNKEKISVNRDSILALDERVISNESYVGNALQEQSSNHSRLRTEFDTAYSYLTNEINQINIKMPPNFSRDINLLNERIDNITGGDDKVDWDDIQNKPNIDREFYLLEQRLNGFEDRQTAHINDFDSRLDHIQNTEINVLDELSRTWDKATSNENDIAQLSSNVDIIKDTQTTYITTFDNRLKYLEENQEQDIEDIQYLSTEINIIKNSKVDWDDIQNIPDINNIETRLSQVEGKQTSYINNFQTQINNINNTVNNNYTYLQNAIDGINTRVDGIDVNKNNTLSYSTSLEWVSESTGEITNVNKNLFIKLGQVGNATNAHQIDLEARTDYIDENGHTATDACEIDIDSDSVKIRGIAVNGWSNQGESVLEVGSNLIYLTSSSRISFNTREFKNHWVVGNVHYTNDITHVFRGQIETQVFESKTEFNEWDNDTLGGIGMLKGYTITLQDKNGSDVNLQQMQMYVKAGSTCESKFIGSFLTIV